MASIPPIPAGLHPSLTRWLETVRNLLGAVSTGSATTGDFKLSLVEMPGWEVADGRWLDKAGNASLYAILGGEYGESDTQFRLPDLIDCVFYGASTPGSFIGADDVSIREANLPAHRHSIIDPGHTHENDPHTHERLPIPVTAEGTVSVTIADPGHDHGVTDPGHIHGGVLIPGTTAGFTGSGDVDYPGDVDSAVTGVTVDTAATGITATATFTGTEVTVPADTTGAETVTISGAETGITRTEATGSGDAISIRQRGFGLLPLIKL